VYLTHIEILHWFVLTLSGFNIANTQQTRIRLQFTVTDPTTTVTFPASVSLNMTTIAYVSGQTVSFADAGTYIFELSTNDGGTTFSISDLTRNRNQFQGNVSFIRDIAGTAETGISMTGPEYLDMYVKNAQKKNITFMNETMVFSFDRNKEIIAALRRVFGIIYKEQMNWESSTDNFEESIKIYKEIGNEKELGDTYFEYGLMLKAKGDVQRAKDTLKESINIFKKLKLGKHSEKVKSALRDL